MISAHFPILQVVIPLMAAPTCVILRKANLVWGVALAAVWIAFGLSISVVYRVLTEGTISYHIGDWAPPIGIEYRIDTPAALVLLIVTLIGVAVMTYARPSVMREIVRDRIYLFYTNFLLCLTGLMGMTVTGDAFNLFVFLEISSLSTYVLVAMGKDRRALVAAFRYLILGTIGATFYVIGIGLLYMMTGTLNIVDLATQLSQVNADGTMVASSRTVLVALAFLTVGLSLKLALFPLHLWLPNAYTYAPSVVTAFLAGTATKVAVYVMLRIFFTVFGPEGSPISFQGIGPILELMAIAGMFAASLVAIFQMDVKRMLAYSSVAQIGYIMLGIALASETGITAGLVHMFNHALIKTALFMAVGCLVWRVGSSHINAFAGMGREMPLTFAVFVIGGLSLIGVPLTVGFISKWQLMLATLEAGQWPVTLLIAASSLLAVIYIWRVVEIGYFRSPPENTGEVTAQGEAPLMMLFPMALMAALTLYFGIDSGLTMGMATEAAQALVGGAP
ncbi:MAG: monovalent cation/H+ antiporter subunit D family protein [Magnetospiraceae bacterium]